jgi:hypothetical protein
MKEQTKMDFNVDICSEKGNETLFHSIEDLFFKFVWHFEGNSFNSIKQYFILRYELASTFKQHILSDNENYLYKLSTGVEIEFRGFDKETTDIILYVSDSLTEFNISINEQIKQCLLSDLQVLQDISEVKNTKAKEKLSNKLAKQNPDNYDFNKILTDKDLEIMLFEKKISPKKPKRSLTKIYETMSTEEIKNPKWLKRMLFENFEYIYTNDQCNCGSDGCFFDILKKNQVYFFKDNYFDEKGEIDEEKVGRDFDTLWENLSFRKRATLLYLFDEFENSTLLNLAFVRPNFDLKNYQFLMCYPLQPDSKEEKMIRVTSSLANYFVYVDTAS